MSHPRPQPDADDPVASGAIGHGRDVLDRDSVASIVAVARRAPSIHNTQPWQWLLRGQDVEVRADRDRQLHVADPDGHSLLISCGAALTLTQIAMRAQGWQIDTQRWPDAGDRDLLARIHVIGRADPDARSVAEAEAAQRRRSERRPFGGGAISESTIEQLRRVAAGPGVFAHFPSRQDEMLDLAVAVSHADRSQRDDPAYAAEMARWVRAADEPAEGVPVTSVPHVPSGEPRHTDIPLRDFEIGMSGAQLIETGVDERPLIAVIFTPSDSEEEQLRAGEAMMRLMIAAEMAGISSCALSQSIDMLAFRERLRTLMAWNDYPQMMLRLGPRPAGEPAPLAPRRPVDDVLTVAAV